MYLKKRGTILISSVVILSLITIIGSFMFKMMRDNNKLLLITNKPNDLIREREIVYFYKEEKVILIPTYKFQDKLK
jgi:hypothetical protein